MTVKGNIYFYYNMFGLNSYECPYEGVMAEMSKIYGSEVNDEELMSGQEFVSMVEVGYITNYDGVIGGIYVNDFESNLGICDSDFMQGSFMVTTDVFEGLCQSYDIKVKWCNK